MLAYFKLAIYGEVLASLFWLFFVVVTGKDTHAHRRDFYYSINLREHKRTVKWVNYWTLIIIVTVEGFGIFLPEIHNHPPIFHFHLYYCAIPFLASLLLTEFVFTGVRTSLLHRFFFARITLVLGIITNVIGAWMAHLLPWQ